MIGSVLIILKEVCIVLFYIFMSSIPGISRLEALISFYLCLFLQSVSLSRVQKNEHPGPILFSSITVLALVYKGYTPAYIYMFVSDQYPQSSNCKNVHSLKTIGTWAMGRLVLFYTHQFGCCPFITFTISILLLTNPLFAEKFQ